MIAGSIVVPEDTYESQVRTSEIHSRRFHLLHDSMKVPALFDITHRDTTLQDLDQNWSSSKYPLFKIVYENLSPVFVTTMHSISSIGGLHRILTIAQHLLTTALFVPCPFPFHCHSSHIRSLSIISYNCGKWLANFSSTVQCFKLVRCCSNIGLRLWSPPITLPPSVILPDTVICSFG